MKTLVIPFLFLMIAVSGCKSSKPKESYPKDIQFINVMQSSQQGPQQRGLFVIHNAEELSKLNLTPLPEELKKVDFKKFMLVVVSAGEKPSGGYGINVVQVKERENTIEVYFKEHSPSKDTFATMALAYPFHAILIPHSSKTVNFSQKAD